MIKSRIGRRVAAAVVAFSFLVGVSDLTAQFQPPGSLGALAPANMAKPRPRPPFDLTGTWLHGGGPDNGFRFSPPPGFKLTLHIIERIRMINDGKTLEIQYAATDPKSWEDEWKWTKRWQRVDERDIAEVECLPELNDHMPTTHSNANVR